MKVLPCAHSSSLVFKKLCSKAETLAMEMHQVRYFLTLCKELNFTRAAEKCNVAQPALTRAIKLLEGEFGGLLFHRERARTHLSELGAAVRPYLEEVARQSQQAKKLASSLVELTEVGCSG
jgi:DNA-binding transcriptional LysR family regulator